MKMKYRIRKRVWIGRKKDDLTISYFIEMKTLFGWYTMTEFLGYDQEWYGFSTIEEAKDVLKKHIELERELNDDNKIVEVIDK